MQRIDEQIRQEREEEDRQKEIQSRPLVLRSGDKNSIEEEAGKILAKDRRQSGAGDYLSEEQMNLRLKKEVYSTNGVPDASLISGMYKRTFNPEFGKRPGKAAKSDA
jgi:hypothetical protein